MNYGRWAVLGVAVFAGCNGGTAMVDMGAGDAGSDAGGDAAADASTVCTTDTTCSDGVFCNGVELCRPTMTGADAHGCVHGTAPCLASMTCDESMGMCITSCASGGDADGDGHRAISCGGDDCDDANANRYPGNPERCDDADQDCDPTTFGTLDADRDGYVSSACCDPSGTAPVCGDDCDDLVADVHPTATEACDGFDNDCNGMVDEGVSITVYPDTDRDGYGDMGSTSVMHCAGTVGFSATNDDCRPMDISVHPGAPEICDGKDNDCNGMIDDGTTAVVWYADLDGDGFGSARSGTQSSCEPLMGFSLLGTDCDDTRHGVSPAANELCNGRDDDCNGLADFRIAPNDFEDDDADGHADAHCSPAGDDCDDRDVNVYPGAPEICDGKDDDCNGVADDMTGTVAWLLDSDGDSYGDDSGTATMSCTQPAGRVRRGGDCDDSDASRHPGAVDVCNGHDDNCNALIDEDAAQTAYWPPGSDADGDGAAAATVMPTLTCMALPAGAVHAGGDCDDTHATIGPGRPEVCNSVDDDCNGLVDDGIGTVTCSMGSGATMCSRTVPGCTAGVAASCSALPPIEDVCNGRDDDCDGLVDEAPDASHSCASSHATAVCTAGACVVAACGVPYADCNHVASDGCEQNLASSVTSCGSCGHTCPSGDGCRMGHCASEVVQLVAADHFSCALMGSGAAFCWGANDRGQLGVNLPDPTVSTANWVTLGPASAPGLIPDATAIAAGGSTGCALRETGALVCWGRGTDAELPGALDQRLAIDSGFSSGTIAQFTVDLVNVMVATTAGSVFAQGTNDNSYGNGVPGGAGSSWAPAAYANHALVAQELHCAGGACVGLDAVTATWWWWGNNTAGKLDSATGSASVVTSSLQLSDVRLPAIGLDAFCRVGHASSNVYCYGANDHGQVGRGVIDALTHVDDVATGSSGGRGLAGYAHHFCAIDDAGAVDCWGANDHGQLGLGTTADTPSPAHVAVPGLDTTSNPATLIAVGLDHSCVALADGTIYCWGGNAFGQLGDGTFVDRHAPLMPVSGLP